MFYIVMGVSGSGKSTVGKLLSDRLNCEFYDADDFHPPDNIAKMNRGKALTDSDREPWLKTLQQLIDRTIDRHCEGVLACSALKQKYRQILTHNHTDVLFIYLQGSYDCILSRIMTRQGHFMGADLLQSQFQALEEPEDALIIDVSLGLEEIVPEICRRLIQKFPDVFDVDLKG